MTYIHLYTTKRIRCFYSTLHVAVEHWHLEAHERRVGKRMEAGTALLHPFHFCKAWHMEVGQGMVLGCSKGLEHN